MSEMFKLRLVLLSVILLVLLAVKPFPAPAKDPLYTVMGNCGQIDIQDFEYFTRDLIIELVSEHDPAVGEPQTLEYLESIVRDLFSGFNYQEFFSPVFEAALEPLLAQRASLLDIINTKLSQLDVLKTELFQNLHLDPSRVCIFKAGESEYRTFLGLDLTPPQSLLMDEDLDLLLFLVSAGFSLKNSMPPYDALPGDDRFRVRALSLDWLVAGQEYVFTGGPGGYPSPVAATALSRYTLPPVFSGDPGDAFNYYRLRNCLTRPSLSAPADVYILDTIPGRFKLHVADQFFLPVNRVYESLSDSLWTGFYIYPYSPGSGEFYTLPNEKYCNEDMSDHGIHIAGIIRQLSPDAVLYLKEVLNMYGSGSLSSILMGFRDVLNSRGDSTAPFVINCSFTTKLLLHTYKPAVRAGMVDRFIEEEPLLAILYAIDDNIRLLGCLNHLLELVGKRGGIITAAAGNDSSSCARLPPGYPAVLGKVSDHVLPVGACGAGGELASYANVPGSPGLLAFGGEVSASGQTVDGNASVYLARDYLGLPGFNTTGRAQWAGSSFSTAVVSGALAALLGDGILSVQDACDVLRNACYTNSSGIDYLPLY